MKSKNQGRPVTKSVVMEVERLVKQHLIAKQIGARIGRSEVSIYNIFRLFNIKAKK